MSQPKDFRFSKTRSRAARRLSREDVLDLVDLENGTICSSIFTDPDIYEMEMEQIFRRTWQFLGHESQIPKRADFMTSSLGADSVIVQRQPDDNIVAMLNQCRHRGATICRAEAGNTRSWRCPYHGWMYDSAGNLASVPREKEAYHNQLNKQSWGLIRVPRVESYRGLIFGNWDEDAEPLTDYLGDAAYYLDHFFDLSEAGTQVVSFSRWITKGNWKWQAEQHCWDNYHGFVSHASALVGMLAAEGVPHPPMTTVYESPMPGVLFSDKARGHGGIVMLFGYGPGSAVTADCDEDSTQPNSPGVPQSVLEHWVKSRAQAVSRVGEFRAKKIDMSIINVFPNMAMTDVKYLRFWNPRGPNECEVYNYIICEADASDEVKASLAHYTQSIFGSSGILEQDDVDNVMYCHRGVTGDLASKTRLNLQMGLGRSVMTEFDAEAPGIVCDTTFSEEGARQFYRRWQEMLLEAFDD